MCECVYIQLYVIVRTLPSSFIWMRVVTSSVSSPSPSILQYVCWLKVLTRWISYVPAILSYQWNVLRFDGPSRSVLICDQIYWEVSPVSFCLDRIGGYRTAWSLCICIPRGCLQLCQPFVSFISTQISEASLIVILMHCEVTYIILRFCSFLLSVVL